MKKILLVLLVISGLFINADSQPCTLGNPGVKLNYTTPEGANCKIGIDLYFDLKHNPGGKWFWVHIWPSSAYANWNYSSPPTMANGGLVGSIASFGVEHQGTNLIVQTSYPPDISAPGFQSGGLTVSEGVGTMAGSERYTVKNLVLTVPGGCNIPQSFTADVWESQSAQSQNVHCFVKGMNFYANDPTVIGLMYCEPPRRYAFTIETINSVGMTVTYKVYIDDGDGIFNSSTDNILVNSGTAVLDASNLYKYQSGVQNYLPYSGQKPYADRDLWVEVTAATVPNAIYAQIVNSCIPLPVNITSFTANRNGEKAELKWTTSMENNNKGFYVERSKVNGGWESVAFIPTKATNGNSDHEIFYGFSDYNISRGVSLYRLRQVDVDNKARYSNTVAIKGVAQSADLIVYPNPYRSGEITIVTDQIQGEFTVKLIDMNGRLVKEWINPGDGKLFLNTIISPGIYTLQAWSKSIGQMGQAKLVILR